MPSLQHQKAVAFRDLHEGPAFIFPNPWDAGSAKVLEALGFKALATTSSGFAFSLGRPDGATTLEEVSAHARALDEATELPVAVDLAAGAVGGSIEDWDPGGRLYEPGRAAERVATAVDVEELLGH